jgi:hypothetical protein
MPRFVEHHRIACLLMSLVACAVVELGLSSSSVASVVVLANRGKQPVEFVVGQGGQWTSRYRLAPRELVPVEAVDGLEIGFLADRRLQREPLGANSLWYLRGDADHVQLQRVQFPMAAGPWLRVGQQNRSKTPEVVVVPVKILVDEEQPAIDKVWRAEATEQLDRLSEFLQKYCGVRLKVVAADTWNSDDSAGNDYRRLDADFRQVVGPEPGRLAIGFSSQWTASGGHMPSHAVRPLDSHLLVPGLNEKFSSSDQFKYLAHQLGHYLGAAHTREEGSIMQPPGGRANAASAALYDPLNTLAMNVVADEIRRREVRSVAEISRGTRRFLFGVYMKMGERGLRDRQMQQLVEMVRDPLPQRTDYVGVWVDGTRETAGELSPGYEAERGPKLNGRRLWDPDNPIRWLLNTRLALTRAPESVIEFFGGDRLPGRVLRYQEGSQLATRQQPGHLIVAPQAAVDSPEGPNRQNLRVAAPWVRRIIWERKSADYEPGTLVYLDGRRLDFQQLRLAPGKVHLLREDGVLTVPLGDLAELHFPARDPWEVHFDEMALLCPGSAERWMQWHTVDGLRVTASANRMESRVVGPDNRRNRPENWYQVVQPAWSLDPLWLNHPRVRLRRYFAPTEVPLSRIPPVAVAQRSSLGGHWPWRIDRNVQGGPLRSGDREFAWGFGVHAFSELQFDLPEAARGFSTRLGLDHLAGDGGCVRAAVRLAEGSAEDARHKPLFESPTMVGSSAVTQVGTLPLTPAAGGPRRLVLQVDSAHQGRPAGADPLDIRDTFDWLEPLVIFDREALRTAVLGRASRVVPAWDGWRVATGQSPGARLYNYREPAAPADRPWQVLAATDRRPLELRGRFEIEDRADQLLIVVDRPAEAGPSSIRVFADDELLDQFDVPVGRPDRPADPHVVSLTEYRGHEIELRLVQQSDEPISYVRWNAARLISQSTTADLGRVFPGFPQGQSTSPRPELQSVIWGKEYGEGTLAKRGRRG